MLYHMISYLLIQYLCNMTENCIILYVIISYDISYVLISYHTISYNTDLIIQYKIIWYDIIQVFMTQYDIMCMNYKKYETIS